MRLFEAKKLRYGQTVYVKGGYNSDGTPMRARVSGKVQIWVTMPNRVKVPIRHGLRDNGYITESNLADFVLKAPAARKPVVKKPWVARTPRPYYPQYGIR